MTLFLVHLGFSGTGAALIRLLGQKAHLLSLRHLLIAYFTGMVSQIAFLYVIAAIRPVPHWVPVALSCAGTAYFLYVSIHGWRRRQNRQPRTAVNPVPTPELWIRATRWINVALIMMLLVPLLINLMVAMHVPVFGWDGIAIWTSKASGLFYGEHLRSPFFADLNRTNEHPGYPIGQPLFLFHHAAVEGEFNEILLTRALMVFLCLWLLAVYDLIREFSGTTAGIAACVVLMYSPVFFTPNYMASPLSGFADVSIAAMMMLSVGWFTSWLLNGGDSHLVGATFALAAVGGIKNEGIVWVGVIWTLCLLSILVNHRKVKRQDLRLMSVPLVTLGVTRLFHAHLPTSSDVHAPSLTEVHELQSMFGELVHMLFGMLTDQHRILGYLPLIITVGLGMALARHWRNRQAVLALVAPAMLLVILAVMGLTKVELDNLDLYTQVTMPRLLLQAAPVSLYWAFILNSPKFPRHQP